MEKFGFKYAGEIRFGPAYNSLLINHQIVANRWFGNNHLLDCQNKNLLFLQEWFLFEESKGPLTSLTVFDFAKKQNAIITKKFKGFVIPEKFKEGKVFYRKENPYQIAYFSIDLNKVENWKYTF